MTAAFGILVSWFIAFRLVPAGCYLLLPLNLDIYSVLWLVGVMVRFWFDGGGAVGAGRLLRLQHIMGCLLRVRRACLALLRMEQRLRDV